MPEYNIEGSDNIVNIEGSATNADIAGNLERQADFESRNPVLTETSLVRRPDAIALDYLTAFSLGPVVNGDTSEGVVSHVWKCKVDNNLKKVYIARENDSKTDWNNETELFSFDDDLAIINEVDIAFEQAGRPVICAERETGVGGSKEVWLYWFDSTDSMFGFDNFGPGRNPRVILDSPLDPVSSDVLLFYLTDTKLVLRQQQDRYAVVIETPFNVDDTYYIEDVVRMRDSRIRVSLSHRSIGTGKYNSEFLDSTLYPIVVSGDGIVPGFEFSSGSLIVVIIEDTLKDIDELDAVLAFISGSLAEPLILVELSDKDSFDPSFEFVSGVLTDILLQKTLFDKDGLDPSFALVSGTLVVVVITHTVFDISQLDVSLAFISGTLETV
jgi:hypothetical protein